jgi:3-dehydroquinate synthase|tara:strand:+ start:307 stop:1416 length:1110 start_codon:yes stop_codon:yes gene_type:complete
VTGAPESNLAAVVHTSQGDYRVLVGRGIVQHLGDEARNAGLHGKAFLVADEAVFRACVRPVQESMESAGFETHVLVLPSGEKTKNLDKIRDIYAWLARLRAERQDVVLALGGGVMGDAAGFAAATYRRGVPFIQVPTTLASMVDASLGGKVAVNLPEGKNLVGAFHQPKLVLSDIDTLNTLPAREMTAGWAEAIKHGLILDPELLSTFETEVDRLFELKDELAVRVIRRSVAIKADVVSADEFETGDTRVLLNYGHTIGHALETVSEYGAFLHGEAVSIGMMGAAHICRELGLISEELIDRQRVILQRYNLPIVAPGMDVEAVFEATKSDKKSTGGAIRWVVLEGFGQSSTRRDVPDELVRTAIASLVG